MEIKKTTINNRYDLFEISGLKYNSILVIIDKYKGWSIQYQVRTMDCTFAAYLISTLQESVDVETILLEEKELILKTHSKIFLGQNLQILVYSQKVKDPFYRIDRISDYIIFPREVLRKPAKYDNQARKLDYYIKRCIRDAFESDGRYRINESILNLWGVATTGKNKGVLMLPDPSYFFLPSRHFIYRLRNNLGKHFPYLLDIPIATYNPWNKEANQYPSLLKDPEKIESFLQTCMQEAEFIRTLKLKTIKYTCEVIDVIEKDSCDTHNGVIKALYVINKKGSHYDWHTHNAASMQGAYNAFKEGIACIKDKIKKDISTARNLRRREKILEKVPQILLVTREDSIKAGNCLYGTDKWTEKNFPGKQSVAWGDIVKLFGTNSNLDRLLLSIAQQY